MSTPDPIAERFARETAKHRMTVLHDDGLYRHLRFTEMHLCNDAEWRTTNGFYWFDLITWPGSLTINGDCGTYTFSRITDMFEFFRGYGINPQYWAEKVQGETRSSPTARRSSASRSSKTQRGRGRMLRRERSR